jgi:pyridoxal/pyridoxine/pyridoxamine kinase
MKNINTEKLIQYINDWADQSERQAYKWGADGYFSEAHKDQVIAEFLREDLVRGIEMDLIDAEN